MTITPTGRRSRARA